MKYSKILTQSLIFLTSLALLSMQFPNHLSRHVSRPEGSIIGVWTYTQNNQSSLNFKEDGSYEADFENDGTPEASGVYTITDSEVSISDKAGKNMCKGAEGATYTFAIEGDKLMMTVVQDACEGRKSILHQSEWKRMQ
ncbi:MAG: hypothetical protein HC880_19275 [Bacteroidia bacterium]|nr:hypothetical protein [Bacteroidia bacterium]